MKNELKGISFQLISFSTLRGIIAIVSYFNKLIERETFLAAMSEIAHLVGE